MCLLWWCRAYFFGLRAWYLLRFGLTTKMFFVVGDRSRNIVVTVMNTQTITLSSSVIDICTNDSFTLTATSADATSKYFWACDGTKIGETTGQNNFTVNAPDNKAGKYYVEVGSGDCDVRSNAIEIKRKDVAAASLVTAGSRVLLPVRVLLSRLAQLPNCLPTNGLRTECGAYARNGFYFLY